MGKLSLNKKKNLEENRNQMKISSFFQAGVAEKKCEKNASSPLFQNVGASKAPPQNKAEKSSREDNSTLLIKPYEVKLKSNSLKENATTMTSLRVDKKLKEAESIKHDTSIANGPASTRGNNTKENQKKQNTSLFSCDSSPLNSTSNKNVCDESLMDSDCDVIPATPGARLLQNRQQDKKAVVRNKIYNSRSFLSSTLSNKPPGFHGNQQQATGSKSKHSSKIKPGKLAVREDVEKNEHKQVYDLTLAQDLNDSLNNQHCNDIKKDIANDNGENNITESRSSESDRKRQRCLEKEIDETTHQPPLKLQKIMSSDELQSNVTTSANDNGNKKPLGLGTRGGLLLKKSLGYINSKCSESGESSEEDDAMLPQSNLKLFSKDSNLQEVENKNKYKKFSWKSNRDTIPIDSRIRSSKADKLESDNVKSDKRQETPWNIIEEKAACYDKIIKNSALNDKRQEIPSNIIEEKAACCDRITNNTALNDILSELNSSSTLGHIEKNLESENLTIPPTVKFVKKKNTITYPTKTSTEVYDVDLKEKEFCSIDHTDTDDALTDIMAELKETLIQQNQVSQKKSSAKKRTYLSERKGKIISQKLNTSISRQLDFEKAFDGIDNDLKSSVKVHSDFTQLKAKTAVSNKNISTGEEEELNSLKTCSKLFDEDSWLENQLDLENLDNTCLSPEKHLLNSTCSETKYDPSTAKPPADAFGRHIVKRVQLSGQDVELLVAEGAQETKQKLVVLKGFWTDTHIEAGDVIHIIGDFNTENICHITDDENFIVVNPDLLISGTTVVSTVYCMRKSVLNEKFKGTDGHNIHMLHGTIIHAFFQEVLLRYQQGKDVTSCLHHIAKQVLNNSSYLHEMYAVGVTQDSVMEEIGKIFPQIKTFLESYMGKKNINPQRQQQELQILDVRDIEENIWSPRFGVKGKIDLTVEVKIHSDKKAPSKLFTSDATTATRLMPLELKTGKASYSVEHKGQVTLYSMMCSDRREDPQGGLLLYLKQPDMKLIPATHSHKRGLIQLRNELAHFLKTSSSRKQGDASSGEFGSLPNPINNERSCSKCPHLLNCTAYLSAVEKKQLSDDHGISKLSPQAIGHLSEEHLQFFSLWCELMHLEANASRSTGARQLWCETAWKREIDEGEAFCGMVLVPSMCKKCEKSSREKYYQAFQRHPHCKIDSALDTVGVVSGDSVVISAENQPLISLCQGNVYSINSHTVVLLVDRDLSKDSEYLKLVFRIDKCDTYNTMATNFTNVSRLMENSEECEKLRELIIERRPPTFQFTLSKTIVQRVMPIFKKLNKAQKTAILKVLMCEDYVLIKGYPGTGKTSTIVALVQILYEIGFSVLLTSYTHSAVDNILLKLKQHDVSFIRMGRTERIHPDIQPYAAENLTRAFTTVQQLEDFYNSQRVVASTCLGTSHVMFSRRRFDLCIVDEASQVLQPACLGPLFCSNKFVLVGDPLQLPPVVQSDEAKNKGMAESLFARLDATGGTYELNMQYRMNSEIMRLSNVLVYDGALKCGSASVASGTLTYPYSISTSYPEWVKRALGTEEGNKVLFLNTENVLDETCYKCSEIENNIEASIAQYLVQQFIEAGMKQSQIGVIAPYKQQVRLIKKLFRGQKLGDIEVNTVDQYQGRDKEVIVLSLVKWKKNLKKRSKEILQDIRRLNVALTRAKYKLLLIGHAECLRQYDPIRDILAILTSQQIVDLPKDTYSSFLNDDTKP